MCVHALGLGFVLLVAEVSCNSSSQGGSDYQCQWPAKSVTSKWLVNSRNKQSDSCLVVARDSLPWELWRKNDSYCSLTCMEPSLFTKRQHPNESNKAFSWTLRNHSDIDFSRYANHQKYSSTTKEFRIKISTVIHERLGRETGERERERERGRERERRAVASVKKKNCNCKNILVKLWLSCEETKEGGERKRNRQNKFDCTEMKWRPSPLFFFCFRRLLLLLPSLCRFLGCLLLPLISHSLGLMVLSSG